MDADSYLFTFRAGEVGGRGDQSWSIVLQASTEQHNYDILCISYLAADVRTSAPPLAAAFRDCGDKSQSQLE